MKDPLHEDNSDGGQTPLTPEERAGLIPSYITVRRDLNEAEQIGISEADYWAFSRKRNILDQAFLRRLHKRMFDGIWRWAGTYRTTARNLGVEAWRIEPDIQALIGDIGYWAGHGTFPHDEIAARFHHRLVWIHPFPNGNGRWSRLCADLLLKQLGSPRFTWGSARPIEPRELRRQYIAALREADRHNLMPLLEFVRT